MDTPSDSPDLPTTLTDTDRLALLVGVERGQRLSAQIALVTRQHADLVSEQKKHAESFDVLQADLRARYALDGNARVDPETGAILRGVQ